jgi:hypothetical protein
VAVIGMQRGIGSLSQKIKVRRNKARWLLSRADAKREALRAFGNKCRAVHFPLERTIERSELARAAAYPLERAANVY